MYYKLIEELEYDMGDLPLSSKKIVFAIQAEDKQEAVKQFKKLIDGKYLNFNYINDTELENSIVECTIKEFESFK